MTRRRPGPAPLLSTLALTLALAEATGCHKRSPPDPSNAAPREQHTPDEPTADAPPADKPQGDDVTRLRGTIETIRLENINKAQDRYTYAVALELRHDGVPRDDAPAWLKVDEVPAVVTVRLPAVSWSKLSPEEQRALAPDGPAFELTPASYGEFSVGQDVVLDVEFSSVGLAHHRP